MRMTRSAHNGLAGQPWKGRPATMKGHYGKTLKLTGTYAVGNLLRKAVQFVLIPITTYYLAPDRYGALALLNVAMVFLGALIEAPLVSGALDRFYYHPSYRDNTASCWRISSACW